MKFSYSILKQLIPEIPPIHEVAEKITMHLFEIDKIESDALEIKILPNRYSDAAGYWGLAREISALCNVPFKIPNFKKPKATVKKSVPVSTSLPNLCRRISAAYVENITIAPSPEWLKQALEISGIRAINNLVDITNYVMLETGQPLHAFDYEKIAGRSITVRQAHEGETVETLDSKIITLNPSALVLADEQHALDIAGIKGGTRAEITNNTKVIALTAANFDGAIIYKTAKRIGLATDASQRFSHNLHPALVERGLFRALELIQKLCGGAKGIIIDEYPKPIQSASIICDVKKYNAIIGGTLSEKDFFMRLKQLGFIIRGKKATPPAERTDIEGFHDIVEEVARLEGYASLAPNAPQITLTPNTESPTSICIHKIRDALIKAGINETYSDSCVREGEISLENPPTSEQGFLRAALMPSLTIQAKNNMRFMNEVKLFEIGNVFIKKINHEPEEQLHLGIIFMDKKNQPQNQARALKGIQEYLTQTLNIPEYTEDAAAIISISQSATLEINLSKIIEHAPTIKTYQAPSKFPAITRDISLIAGKNIKIGKLMEAMHATASENLNNIKFIDSYEDVKLPVGTQSLTFRIVLKSPIRTLKDREADEEIKTITEALKSQFQVEIR